MSDNLNDAFNTFKKMVDSGNIPNDVQGLINNLKNENNDSNKTIHNMLSQVSPEMLNNLSSMLNSSSSNDSDVHSSSSFNLDPQTIMKMTSIINNINKKDNPGANLLHSLKPYLRDSRKSKLDQYANLLNITKIADVLKNDKKGDS